MLAKPIIQLFTGTSKMKTFQLFRNVSYEYFIEAETLEEAKNKIMNENPNYESEELIEWVFFDEHNGENWKYEPANI
jgi:hypothetical protein